MRRNQLRLAITLLSTLTVTIACNEPRGTVENMFDNDMDGLVDLDEPKCISPSDDNEDTFEMPTECVEPSCPNVLIPCLDVSDCAEGQSCQAGCRVDIIMQ